MSMSKTHADLRSKNEGFSCSFFSFSIKNEEKRENIFDNSYKQQSCHLKELEVKEQKKKLFYWRPSCSIIINANQTCHNLNVLTVHQACTNRNCYLLQCVDLLKMQPVVDGFKTF